MKNLQLSFDELTTVRSHIDSVLKSGTTIGSGHTATLRLLISAIEHQIAVIRLCQSEDRLKSYFWQALIGLAGVALGAVIGHLEQFHAILIR